MTCWAPIKEQRVALEYSAGLPDLVAHPRFAAATPELIDAILESAAAFAEREFAPLDRIDDAVGACWQDGAVTMPPCFAQAYCALVEAGWGTLSRPEEFGPQALPFSLSTVMFESLGGTNMASALTVMLGANATEALATHGSPEQLRRWLPKLVSGRMERDHEPDRVSGGIELGVIRTLASRAPDGGWRVARQKIFITFGGHDLTAKHCAYRAGARARGLRRARRGCRCS